MRLLTTRLARAFPELDRFDDAQADAFCRAAVRQLWPRVVRWVLVCVFGCVAVVLTSAILSLATSFFIPMTRDASFFESLGRIVLAVVLLALGFASTILMRDWLLRRRVRVVIRQRGTCPRCKYVLLGQPVSAELRVSCPECGLSITADPSMRELATDAAGRSVFKPEAPELDPALLARRARRRRRLVKAAIWMPISTISAVLIAALVGWVLILAQARRAKAIVAASPAKIVAIIERGQPTGSTDADNQWAAMMKVVDAFTAKVAMAPGPTAAEAQDGATLDMLSLAYPATPSVLPGVNETAAATRTFSRRVFDAVRSSPIADDLRALEKIPGARFLRPWSDPGADAPTLGINASRNSLPQMRSLARFNGARMHQAILDKDRGAFEQAMAQNLGLSHGLRRQPTTLEVLVALAIEATTMGIVEHYLSELAELGWLETVQTQLAPLVADPTDATAMAYEVATMEAADSVARYFSDSGRVSRVLTLREGLPVQIGGPPAGTPTNPWRVGTMNSNIDALRDIGGNVVAWVKINPVDRPRSWLQTSLPAKGTAIAGLAAEPWVVSLRSIDQLRLTARGVYTITAIERFRARTGRLPGALSELTPTDGVTSAVFISDIHTRGTLQYMTTGPVIGSLGAERAGQRRSVTLGYKLYSVGLDGIDNNATPHSNPYQALLPGGAGTDFLFGVNRD